MCTQTHIHTDIYIYQMISTKRKTEGEQHTEPKNGLTVIKGIETGVYGWEWRFKGRRKKRGIV